MSNTTLYLTDALYHYLQQNSLREHTVLEELRNFTATLPSGRMQIAPEQGQFMGFLIELMGARKTLEIGVYTGYSALAVALALPKEGQIVACDINTEWTDIAKRYWQKAGVAEKIALRLAPANDTLDSLIAAGESHTFDFAFIDADKAKYDDYYEKSLKLVRPGGLILLDNVFLRGKVIDEACTSADAKAMRALNKKIRDDQRVSMSMLALADGLTLVRRRS